MKKIVVLSGGMDSLVALAKEIKDGHQVECLNFQYGSKHNDRESIAALSIIQHYGVKIKFVPLDFIKDSFKSDLLKSGGEVPEGHYEDDNMKQTVVPFRNGIMLAIAAGYAESVDAQAIVLGNHAGDHAIYPDCRADFATSMAEAIAFGTYAQIRLESPFVSMTKSDIVRLGEELLAPFQLTWSCYKGGRRHCGRCGTCVERREAFELAGIEDSTIYEYAGPLPERA